MKTMTGRALCFRTLKMKHIAAAAAIMAGSAASAKLEYITKGDAAIQARFKMQYQCYQENRTLKRDEMEKVMETYLLGDNKKKSEIGEGIGQCSKVEEYAGKSQTPAFNISKTYVQTQRANPYTGEITDIGVEGQAVVGGDKVSFLYVESRTEGTTLMVYTGALIREYKYPFEADWFFWRINSKLILSLYPSVSREVELMQEAAAEGLANMVAKLQQRFDNFIGKYGDMIDDCTNYSKDDLSRAFEQYDENIVKLEDNKKLDGLEKLETFVEQTCETKIKQKVEECIAEQQR